MENVDAWLSVKSYRVDGCRELGKTEMDHIGIEVTGLHLAPGTWHFGTWHLAPGTWHLAPCYNQALVPQREVAQVAPAPFGASPGTGG